MCPDIDDLDDETRDQLAISIKEWKNPPWHSQRRHTSGQRGYKMTAQKPLRLWPAVVIAIVQLLVMIGAPVVAPDAGPIGMLGGIVGALAVAVWWVFFSRALWSERVGAIVL